MSKPELIEPRGSLLPGLAAAVLFGVLTAVFITADIGSGAGFSGDGSITAAIGYAMFNMLDQTTYQSEQFLVAFEIIDVVLVAALVGAVMLARRESEESVMTALTDGGRDVRESDHDDDGGDD